MSTQLPVEPVFTSDGGPDTSDALKTHLVATALDCEPIQCVTWLKRDRERQLGEAAYYRVAVYISRKRRDGVWVWRPVDTGGAYYRLREWGNVRREALQISEARRIPYLLDIRNGARVTVGQFLLCRNMKVRGAV